MFHNTRNYQAAVLLSAVTLPAVFAGCNRSDINNSGSNGIVAADSSEIPETASFSTSRETEQLFIVPADLAEQIESSDQGSAKELKTVYFEGGSLRTVEFSWQGLFIECTENTFIQNNKKLYSVSLYEGSQGSDLKFPIEADFSAHDAEKLFILMQNKK